MKLKTRLVLAWVELAIAVAIWTSVVVLDFVSPHPGLNMGGRLIIVLLPAFLLAPVMVSSWKRLRKTRAQLAELGPEAAPSADLWTAPGGPGIIGIMVISAAVFAALVPALLRG